MEMFRSEKFRSYVEDLMSLHHVPGLAIALVQGDEIASEGYGKAYIEPPVPCTSDTLFDFASCAKSLTAASVGLLVDDNEQFPEVQYDALMSTLLPDDFVMPGVGYTEGVTVEDVLSHRTGMAAHDNSYFGPQAAQPDDARSITRNLRNLPVAAPIRARYLYCNMMYTAASYLVEVRSGQSFVEFLHERFFQPLDMKSTSLQPKSARVKGFGDRIATGYHWNKDSSTYHGFQSPDCPEGQGAGSIISSVVDFAKWVQALMNRKGPINEKVYQGLIRMRSFVNPNARRLKPHSSPAAYAAGLEVHYYRGHMVVGHNGTIDGFGSRFFFVPSFNFGAVIVGNSIGAGPIGTILARDLIDEVLQIPEADRPYRQRSRTPKISKKRDKDVHPKQKFENKGNTKGANEKKLPGTSDIPAKDIQPQELPPTLYTGKYWHPGYHNITVQVKGGKLFVDARDRSMGFILTFDHICDQTKYAAHLSDFLEDGIESIQAEFIFEDGIAVKLGLGLELALKEMIWFTRVHKN